MLPSVTQVLQPWADFSMVPADVLEIAANRGTDVHRICAALSLGLWPGDIPDDCAGYVESFRAWLPFVSKVILVECHLEDRALGYCGHPDIIAIMRGDTEPAIVDLKTPASKSRLWRVQLAAYLNLGRVNGHPINRVFSLRLRRDGARPIVDEYRDSALDFKAFLNALSAWRYFKQ